MNQKLTKKIAKKLDKLLDLLKAIDEANLLQPDEPETWDSDILYDLLENLKKALQLLQDQTGREKDAWGEPMVLEEGLCSLMDQYEEDQEEEEDD